MRRFGKKYRYDDRSIRPARRGRPWFKLLQVTTVARLAIGISLVGVTSTAYLVATSTPASAGVYVDFEGKWDIHHGEGRILNITEEHSHCAKTSSIRFTMDKDQGVFGGRAFLDECYVQPSSVEWNIVVRNSDGAAITNTWHATTQQYAPATFITDCGIALKPVALKCKGGIGLARVVVDVVGYIG